MKPITRIAAALLLAMTILNTAHADPWKGFYAGAGLENWGGGEETGINAVFGYNKTVFEKYVFGGEVTFFTDMDQKFQSRFIAKRGGYLLNPKTLIYATAGIGSFSDGDSAMRAGIGLEWARSDRFTIRLEATKEQCCGNPILEGAGAVRAMAVWHF